ncbi:MAG: winged helix-turn-helix domain-containing protein [Anaerolineales bacterium]|nr:winged helix-turn-helix domain-containing protein [Anaerolineales bacterium]
MSTWDQYPSNYRAQEVETIRRAVCAGGCVSVVGLSGSGKSNLLGFIAHRLGPVEGCPRFVLVDCNRLVEITAGNFFHLALRSLGEHEAANAQRARGAELPNGDMLALEAALGRQVTEGNGVCLLLDRFDALSTCPDYAAISGNLRALRDAYKYRLTYVIATRRPIEPESELAELFFGHTLWLGPLTTSDALWSASRDAARFSMGADQGWSQATLEQLVEMTWGYPSLLRAACEAYANGAEPELSAMSRHPAITRRAAEFWADQPDERALRNTSLWEQPLLEAAHPQKAGQGFDASHLTAKENLLLEYFLQHAGQVCEKDDLVRAVWPEDVIYEQGVRDESLAQLVRRLRVKIEPEPGEPRYIHTAPGRGYLFKL